MEQIALSILFAFSYAQSQTKITTQKYWTAVGATAGITALDGHTTFSLDHRHFVETCNESGGSRTNGVQERRKAHL